jgi:UDP-N-acetylglucosamine/UDP-N-acetylgalactosamine 4-epimerase
MHPYQQLTQRLLGRPNVWLITGGAGFTGSNLTEARLGLNQRVIGFDNFSPRSRRNLA